MEQSPSQEPEVVEEQLDLTTEPGVVKYMSESSSEGDWNSRCEDVRAANGGDYPSFWVDAIIMSGGVISETQSRW